MQAHLSLAFAQLPDFTTGVVNGLTQNATIFGKPPVKPADLAAANQTRLTANANADLYICLSCSERQHRCWRMDRCCFTHDDLTFVFARPAPRTLAAGATDCSGCFFEIVPKTYCQKRFSAYNPRSILDI